MSSYDSLLRQGEALLQQQRYGEAIRVFGQAALLDANRAEAYIRLGLICRELGDAEGSAGFFARAAEVEGAGSGRSVASDGRDVTFLIPFYDRITHFQEYLSSGKWDGARLQLVCDGAEPAFVDALRGLVADRPLTAVHAYSPNRGLARARAEGFRQIETPYVALCDDDDFVSDVRAYQRAAADVLDGDGEVLLVTLPQVISVTREGGQQIQYDRRWLAGRTGKQLLSFIARTGELNLLTHSTYRTPDMQALAVDDFFRHNEDVVMLARLAARHPDRRIHVLPEGAYVRLTHAASLSSASRVTTFNLLTGAVAMSVAAYLLAERGGITRAEFAEVLARRGAMIQEVYGKGRDAFRVVEALLTGGDVPARSSEALEAIELLQEHGNQLPAEFTAFILSRSKSVPSAASAGVDADHQPVAPVGRTPGGDVVPDVTFLVRFYDRLHHFAQYLHMGYWDGVRLQLVCDGSTPDFVRRLRGYVQDRPEVSVWASETNRGIARARAEGVNQIRTPFTAVCDDDDYLLNVETYARLGAEVLRSDPEALLVAMPEVRHVNLHMQVVGSGDLRPFDGVAGLDLLEKVMRIGQIQALGVTTFRTEDLQGLEVNDFFRNGEDLVMLARLCARHPERRVRVLGEGTCAYMRLVHSGGISQTGNFTVEKAVRVLFAYAVAASYLLKAGRFTRRDVLEVIERRGRVLQHSNGVGADAAAAVVAYLEGRSPSLATEEIARAWRMIREHEDELPSEIRELRRGPVSYSSGAAATPDRKHGLESALGAPGGLKIAFVCGPDRKFIREIEAELARRHQVHTCYFDAKVDLAQLQAALDWADVTWFEWCDAILVNASKRLRKSGRVVCRLHSYEAFTDLPTEVRWDFVDHVVFVAPHIRELMLSRGLTQVASSVVPNGVPLHRLAFKERARSFNIAYVGYLNYKKNPEMLLQCMADLVRRDSRYHLHIAGAFQDLRYQLYFEKMIPALGLQDHVHFHGWVDDIDAWLEDKSFLVSTSVLESFGMGIAEGMAKGLKPIIHNWVGAEHIFPRKYLFNTVAEFSDLVLEDDYEPAAYRRFIADNYAFEDQVKRLEELLCELTGRREQPARPKEAGRQAASKPEEAFVSADYWEQRYARGGNSGAGSYGKLAEFKAEVLNAFVRERQIRSVIDFGCGDGAQLALAEYPSYVGLDVSPTAVQMCRRRFAADPTKRFIVYDPANFDTSHPAHRAELAISLDVLYHLIEEDVYERYLHQLFAAAEKYVVIYANDSDERPAVLPKHVRFRSFTAWIAANKPEWRLVRHVPNRYPLRRDLSENPADESFSDFYFFEKVTQEVSAGDGYVRLPEGLTMQVLPGDYINKKVGAGRFYEQEMLDYVRRQFPAGMRIVDVGAHIGNHTLFFAACCQAARVDAFEPNPPVLALLRENVRRNGLKTVVVHGVGVGAASGRAHLQAGSQGNTGMMRLKTDTDGAIEVVTLDDTITHPVDLIKIDVEGAAGSVLHGARRLLRTYAPALLVECADEGEYQDVADVLAPLGYRPRKRFNYTPTILFEHMVESEERRLPVYEEVLAL